MYTKERAAWWIERSQSPEYRDAYDLIAKLIPCPAQGVYVDLCCGNGEMLRRLCVRDPEATYVGFDGSPVMLDAAKRMLEDTINVVRRDAKKPIEPVYGSVLLVAGNIFTCTIPDNCADATIFTFPDTGCIGIPANLANALITAYEASFGTCLPQFDRMHLKATLAVQHHLKRLTKQGGTMTVAYYCAKSAHEGDFSLPDPPSLRDMGFRKQRFIESPSIHDDAADARVFEGKIRGYRVLQYEIR